MPSSSLRPSIIMYTVLTNDSLVSAVHLFGYTKNTIIIWGYCDELLFLHLRFCQPDGMFCHVLGINVGSFCLLGLRRHASFLHGTVGLELCTLILYSFVHLFIPPPGFWLPLFVLAETTNFGGSIQQGPFSFDQADSTQFPVSAPEAVATATAALIVFTLKTDWTRLAEAGSLSFQVWMWGENLHFSHGDVSGEVAHYHVVLFDAFSLRDDFHIADCTAETLRVVYVIYLGWVATRAVCDQVCVSLLEPGALCNIRYPSDIHLKLKSREASFAHNSCFSWLIALKFCTGHGSITAVSVLCAKFQTDWAIETDVMDERDFARFEFRTDILYCTVPTMLPTIGYGEFKDSLTLRVMGTEALSIMGIAVHTDRSANVTVPVTNWDELLTVWNLGNVALQLVVENFAMLNWSKILMEWLPCLASTSA